MATAEYVSAKEREIAANAKQIARLIQQISETEASASKLQARQPFLGNQIDELQSSLPGIELEIELAEKSLVLAEQQQSSFDETLDQRKAGVVREADKRAQDQYRKKVEELAIARKKRDELRVKRGARGQDQSEAQYELSHRRRAKQEAESKYANLARIAHSQLDTESARLAESVSSARERVAMSKRRRDDALAQIKSTSEELVRIREEIEAVPIRIASLRNERESLFDVQQRSENDLREATSALREKEASYVALRSENSMLGQPQTDDYKSWAAPPAHYATQNNTVGWLPSGSQGYAQPYGVGRYYDYRYRPPVGEHFVIGHFRSNGTYVRGHFKTNADNSFWNNWSSRGNVNPRTGHVGTKLPRLNSYLHSPSAHRYGRRDGY